MMMKKEDVLFFKRRGYSIRHLLFIFAIVLSMDMNNSLYIGLLGHPLGTKLLLLYYRDNSDIALGALNKTLFDSNLF